MPSCHVLLVLLCSEDKCSVHYRSINTTQSDHLVAVERAGPAADGRCLAMLYEYALSNEHMIYTHALCIIVL